MNSDAYQDMQIAAAERNENAARQLEALAEKAGDGVAGKALLKMGGFFGKRAGAAKKNIIKENKNKTVRVGDWEELFDKQANSKYYFNHATGDTTTVKPDVMKSRAELKAEQDAFDERNKDSAAEIMHANTKKRMEQRKTRGRGRGKKRR